MTVEKKNQQRALTERVKEIQDYFSLVVPPEVKLVEELIAERRAEASVE